MFSLEYKELIQLAKYTSITFGGIALIWGAFYLGVKAADLYTWIAS
jgi:hypothetical protein